MSYTSSPAWYESPSLHDYIDYEYEQQESSVYESKVQCDVFTDDNQTFFIEVDFPWMDESLIPFFSGFHKVEFCSMYLFSITLVEATLFPVAAENEIREVFDKAIDDIYLSKYRIRKLAVAELGA